MLPLSPTALHAPTCYIRTHHTLTASYTSTLANLIASITDRSIYLALVICLASHHITSPPSTWRWLWLSPNDTVSDHAASHAKLMCTIYVRQALPCLCVTRPFPSLPVCLVYQHHPPIYLPSHPCFSGSFVIPTLDCQLNSLRPSRCSIVAQPPPYLYSPRCNAQCATRPYLPHATHV